MTKQDIRPPKDTRDLENEVAGKEIARLREINAELLEALVKFRIAVSMGPLDIAASYGPDAHPDIALEDAARVAEIAIAKTQEEAT